METSNEDLSPEGRHALAAKIRELRGDHPQAEMAKRAGVSQPTWRRWERGGPHDGPPLKKLFDIEQALRVRPGTLCLLALGYGAESPYDDKRQAEGRAEEITALLDLTGQMRGLLNELVDRLDRLHRLP